MATCKVQNTKIDFTSDGTDINASITATDDTLTFGSSGGGGVTLTGLKLNPTNDSDAVTKKYVDDSIEGLDVKLSVKTATTAAHAVTSGDAGAGTLTLNDGVGGFNATNDSFTVNTVSLSQNDRVLIKNGVSVDGAAAANKWNGIYTVGALNGNTLVLTRAEDMNTTSESSAQSFTFVEGPTGAGELGGTGWAVTTAPATLGTNDMVWTQFNGAGAFTQTAKQIKIDGNTLSFHDDEFEGNNDVEQ